MNASVGQLTAALAAGDTQAFQEFYEQWFDFIFLQTQVICSSNGRFAADENLCLDIVHDAMIRIIRYIKPMHDQRSLERWLKAVVRCSCYDHFRAQRRRKSREVARTLNETSCDSHNHVIDEQLNWLREQLATLGPQELHLLTLRFRCENTLAQIARVMGLKTGAVDGRILRILKSLRKKARKEFGDA